MDQGLALRVQGLELRSWLRAEDLGLYSGNIGIMEKNMETAI